MEQYLNHQHDVCVKEVIEEIIMIECANCIDKVIDQRSGDIYNCLCAERTLRKMACKHCNNIKKEIEDLNNHAEDITYHIRYNMKKYYDCTELIDELHKISILTRQYQRLLVEKK